MVEPSGRITVDSVDGACIVHLIGEIDASLREQASESMVDVLSHAGPIVIDTSHVTFIDSTGLAFIFQIRKVAQQEGRSIALRRPAQVVTDLIDMAGMSDLIAVANE